MERVEAAMRTPDDQWRIEVIRRRRDCWYRIWRGDTLVLGHAAIGTVQHLLGDAFATLEEAAA